MMLPALKADALSPAGMGGVQRVVGRRFGLYPPMSMSEGAWAAWWQDYADALADLPEAAIEEGMRAWLKNPEADFLPKPGRLRQLAQQATVKAIVAYDRAKAATVAGQPPEEKPRAAKEAVQALLAEFRARMAQHAAERPQRAPLPSIQGKPDATGITAQLRRVIERNAEAAE